LAMSGQLWEVVGGAGKGGIVVRDGQDTASTLLDERLSTGALVRELALEGERLHFERLEGNGPLSGWVSLRLKDGKDLVVRATLPEVRVDDTPDMPLSLRPSCRICGNVKPGNFLEPLRRMKGVEELAARIAKNLPGDKYGLEMPKTCEELWRLGPDWLTRAFHAAGTLGVGNAVTRIVSLEDVSVRRGGGAGPKCTFTVEYKELEETLHTELFMKVPWTIDDPVWGEMRIRNDGLGVFGDTFGAEINAYAHLCPYLPFSTPKYYFGDVNRETTNACIITAAVPWPSDEKAQAPAEEYDPFEVFPSALKAGDHFLKVSPHLCYLSMVRKQGVVAALHKRGSLGPHAMKVQWTPVAKFSASPAVVKSHIAPVIEFIQETVPHWFPEETRTPAYAAHLQQQMEAIAPHVKDLVAYCDSNPHYSALQHRNANTDNAYFFKRPDGTIDCGLLDWGQCAEQPFAQAFMFCFTSAQGQMLAEHEETFLKAFLEEYSANGGRPTLDIAELRLQFHLFWIAYCMGQAWAGAREWNQRKEALQAYPSLYGQDIYDAFKANQAHFGLSQVYQTLLLWSLRGDAYFADFERWRDAGKGGFEGGKRAKPKA